MYRSTPPISTVGQVVGLVSKGNLCKQWIILIMTKTMTISCSNAWLACLDLHFMTNEQRRVIYQCDRFRWCATITEIAAKKRSAVVVIIQRCLCLSQRSKRSYGNHSFQIVCSAGRSLIHVFTGILFYSVAIVVIVWKLEVWLGIAWHFLGRSWVDCGNQSLLSGSNVMPALLLSK